MMCDRAPLCIAPKQGSAVFRKAACRFYFCPLDILISYVF